MLTEADWDSLRRYLVKEFDEDTAQYALMKLVQRLNLQSISLEGEVVAVSDFLGYCRVVARNYKTRQQHREAIFVVMAEPQTGEDFVPPVFREDVTPERIVLAKDHLQHVEPELMAIVDLQQEHGRALTPKERMTLWRERCILKEKAG